MMVWLRPLVLLGLAAVAAPILIHLLRRQRATRVPFPTIRFLEESRAAAVRLRSISDPRLLAVRMAVIAAAVLAAAQPHLWTRWQLARLDGRTTRAVIVDVSDSMQASAARRDEAAAAERQSDRSSIEIRTKDIGAALDKAVAALRDGPAGRHEIAVISDFQHGALGDADLAQVPQEFGVRFVAVAPEQSPAPAAGSMRALSGDGGTDVSAEFRGPKTVASYGAGRANAPAATELFAGPVAADDAQRLMSAVVRSAAASPQPERPVAIVLAGMPLPDVTSPRTSWMLRAIAAARQDSLVQEAAAAHQSKGSVPGGPWIPVARDAKGRTVVAAGASGNRLITFVDAAPSDLIAVVALRTLLGVTGAVPDWNELETQRIPPAKLREWTRETSPIPPERLRPEPPGWARWLWGLVLVLLGVESVVRRERIAAAEDVRRAA